MNHRSDGETIGLLHSAGYQNDGKVHGIKDYSALSLGDSDNDEEPVAKYSLQYFVNIMKPYLSRQNILLFTSVFVLIIATAMERVTFKIMVDRMLPYKSVLVQIIFILSGFLFVGLTRLRRYINPEIHAGMAEFPQVQILIMAVIDTIPFLFMAFSASGVPPTMTVVLMHSSTIFVVLGSKVIFPQRHYSKYNHIGIGLIGCAIALCLIKVMFWRMDLISSASSEVALSCWVFLFAASLHGVSTLYKEKSIIEWGRPIDIMYLSSCLFFFQCVVTFVIALVVNFVWAVAGYEAYNTVFANIYDGWKCFLGFDSHLPHDEMYVDCSDSMGVVLGYVVCNAAVVVCMSTVLQMEHHLLGRATEAAILCAFLVLWIYDVHVNRTTIFGGNEGLGDVLAIIVLIAGMEVYDKDPEPDVEVIANHASLHTSPTSSQGEGSNNNSASGTPL